MEPKTNTSRTEAAGRIVAGNYWSAPRPYLHALFGCVRSRGLVFHVHDLDAAVYFGHRLARILELALAVSDGHEIGAGFAYILDVRLPQTSAADEVLIYSVAIVWDRADL